MKDGDVKIIMNVYYNPVDGLRKLIEENGSLYVPVIGGAADNRYCTDEWCKSHLERDDSGDSITDKNGRYNEWTSVYWYWKNRLQVDKPKYVGYNHYRRYFAKEQLSDICDYDIVTAKPLPMAYYTPQTGNVMCDIERAYSVFHSATDWLEMELEMTKRGFDLYGWKRLGFMPHPCNMFVMKRPVFEEFCGFMFDVLDALDPRIDTTGRDNYQKRAMAFLSERILSFWVEMKKATERLSVKEIDSEFKPEWKDNYLNERGTY